MASCFPRYRRGVVADFRRARLSANLDTIGVLTIIRPTVSQFLRRQARRLRLSFAGVRVGVGGTVHP